MFRTKLLAATAIATLALSGAQAADNTVTNDNTMGTKAASTAMDANGYVQASADQILASRLMGETIYTSNEADAGSLGDVNDLVLSKDGRVQAVVIGVGGFLGIGDKNVAVPFDRLQIQGEADGAATDLSTADNTTDMKQTDVNRPGTVRYSLQASKQELQDAPEYNVDMTRSAANDVPPAGVAANGDQKLAQNAPAGTADATNADNAANVTTNPMNRDNMQVVANADLSADNLIGATVYDGTNDDIGEIGDVILQPKGEVQALVIDVGGFLGLGEKHVALDASNLQFRRDANDQSIVVFTSFTREQLENQKEYDPEGFKDDPDTYLMR
jgi:sporulation protein YlmC with PRC-barrel domain